ncbi:MAG: hypothetical protein KDI46_00585 [Alphaproteobacteria bacterium]|nr:hypothetical protein [Alphaproteobacteria bacterium]
MSREYAEHRIKEALKLSGGNMLKARQQIIAWTYEDTKLLHELTKPHLSGIVAYNIERVASGRAEAAKQPPSPPAEQPPKPAPVRSAKSPAKKPENAFGMELLKAVASEHPTIFGLEDNGALKRPQGVSQKHIDAINAIAGKAPKKDD